MSAPTYELSCPPKGTQQYVDIAPELADRLAFYKAYFLPGILAPRGWHCFASGASPGLGLTVAPDPLKPFSGEGLPAHAVVMSVTRSDTLGRLDVARMVARLFPVAWPDARKVAEGTPALIFGAFPNDQLVYKSAHVVQFTTPAHTMGFGTEFFGFEPNQEPVRGIAILTKPSGYVFKAAVRLPKDLSSLTSAIIGQVRDSRDWSAPQ